MRFSLCVVLLLIAFSANSVAQKKTKGAAKTPPTTVNEDTPKGVTTVPIEGMGMFKLNKSTPEIMDTLASALGVSIIRVSKSRDEYKLYGRPHVAEVVWEPVIGEGETRLTSAMECPDVRVFKSFGYKLLDIIDMGSTYWTFYEGRLVSIRCESSKMLTDAMALKYGKGYLEVDEDDTPCSVQNDETYFTTWRHGTIVATDMLMVYHNDDCDRKVAASFTVKDSAKMELVEKCESARKSARDASELNEKQKKVKDF